MILQKISFDKITEQPSHCRHLESMSVSEALHNIVQTLQCLWRGMDL